ncbi:SMC family ATPase [Candidatus Woesearchaeota archaeon]|nr:SMC family ATPase [Candidatus Woesearchaeota archaeon]
MRLQYIKLENIRSYVTNMIQFPEGSLLLSGDIGSGKSTILLAIEFALFGLKRKQLSGTSLLRHGKPSGSVELCLGLDGKEIIIKRGLKRSKTSVTQDSGYIIINGVKEELTPMELKARVFEILGYPSELVGRSEDLIYRYTVYTPQEEMKHILYEDPDARLDTLRKVFGIDKYKRVVENTNIFLRKVRETQKELEGQIQDLEEKEKAYQAREEEITSLVLKLETIRPNLERVQRQMRDARTRFEETEKKISELMELRKLKELNEQALKHLNEDKERCKSEIADSERQLAHLSKEAQDVLIEGIIEDPLKIEEDIINLQNRISEYNTNKIRTKDKINFLTQKISELKHDINEKTARADVDVKRLQIEDIKSRISRKEELAESIRRAESRIETLRDSISKLRAHKENTEGIIQDISGLRECPTCFQLVTEDHKHKVAVKQKSVLGEFERKLTDIDAEYRRIIEDRDLTVQKKEGISKLEREYDRLMLEIKQAESLSEEVEKKMRIISTYEAELKKAAEDSKAFESFDATGAAKSIEELKRKLNAINQIKIKMERKRNIENNMRQATARIESLSKSLIENQDKQDKHSRKIRDIDARRSQLSGVEGIFDKIKRDLEEITEAERRLELDKISVEKEKETLVNINKSLREEIRKKQETRARIESLLKLKNWFSEHFVNMVNTMEKHVMYRVYNEFNDTFRKWFNELIEEEIMTTRLDDSFTPLIEQNGYEAELDALSGGERTAVALAYRLALNRVINDIISDIKTNDLIILDEPTDGFSTEQLDKVGDVLREMGVKQTIIVSHETKIEGFVDNVLRVRKEGHVSSVS